MKKIIILIAAHTIARGSSTVPLIYDVMNETYYGTNNNCLQEVNPLACCQSLSNVTDRESCQNTALISMIKTNQTVGNFAQLATTVDNLTNQLAMIGSAKDTYCATYQGASATPEEIQTCSPQGWYNSFTENIFQPPFFAVCPGMFYYLANVLPTTGSITQAGLVADIKAAFTRGLGSQVLQEPANAQEYYTTFYQNYPNLFYQFVMLPFILIGQKGLSIINTPNIFWEQLNAVSGYYAGLTNPINNQSGYLWDTLSNSLTSSIGSSFNLCLPYGQTLNFYSSNPNITPVVMSPNFSSLLNQNPVPTAATFFNDVVLGASMAGLINSGIGIWMGTNGTSMYERYLNCCPTMHNCVAAGLCASNSDTSPACTNCLTTGTSLGSSGFMCNLLTAQYNIVQALSQNGSTQLVLNSLGSIQTAIQQVVQQNCSLVEQQALQSCMSNSFSKGVAACTPSSCQNQQDTSPGCIACVAKQVENYCQTPTTQAAIQSCAQKALSSSSIKTDLENIAQALTAISNARLLFAQVVRTYSLNQDQLPELTAADLKPACYALCGTENAIMYQSLPAWTPTTSNTYMKEFSFLSQMSSTIYQNCPQQQTGVNILMAILGVVGPILGLVFSIEDPVMLLMWAITQGVSATQQGVQGMMTAQSAIMNLQQTEDTLGSKS